MFLVVRVTCTVSKCRRMSWDISRILFFMVDSGKALLHSENFQGKHWKEKELKDGLGESSE